MDSKYIITPSGTFVNTDELYHWGIKGMKWGQRRYQNPDGSLTAAGRKRYMNSDGSLNEKGKKYYAKETERLKAEKARLNNQKRSAAKLSKLDQLRKENAELNTQLNGDTSKKTSKLFGKKKQSEAGQNKKKSVKDMTDEELDAAINRARKEDEYNRLRPEQVSTKTKFMNKLVNDVIAPAAINAGKNALDNALKNMLKEKVDPNSLEALRKTAEKLRLETEINKLKKGPELSWDDRTKKYNLERQQKRDAEADAAADAAKKAKEEAEKAKSDAEARRRRQNVRNVWDRMNSNRNQSERSNPSQDEYEFDWDSARPETVEGRGSSSRRSSNNSQNSSSSNKKSTIDADWFSRVDDTPVTDLTTTRSTSSGRTYISGYLNAPVSSLPSPNIAGYLSAPKDDDD